MACWDFASSLNQKDYFSAWYGSENLRRVQGNTIKTLPTRVHIPCIKIVLLYSAGYKEDLLNKSYYLLQAPFTTEIVSTCLLSKMGKLLDHCLWSQKHKSSSWQWTPCCRLKDSRWWRLRRWQARNSDFILYSIYSRSHRNMVDFQRQQ